MFILILVTLVAIFVWLGAKHVQRSVDRRIHSILNDLLIVALDSRYQTHGNHQHRRSHTMFL